jgi:hypothetical protein
LRLVHWSPPILVNLRNEWDHCGSKYAQLVGLPFWFFVFVVYCNWQRLSSWYFARIMDALKLGMKQAFQGQTGIQRHGDFKDNISK